MPPYTIDTKGTGTCDSTTTTLYYLPPTTEADPKQKYVEMAKLEDISDADIFKRKAIKDNPELRKGSWFFGNARI